MILIMGSKCANIKKDAFTDFPLKKKKKKSKKKMHFLIQTTVIWSPFITEDTSQIKCSAMLEQNQMAPWFVRLLFIFLLFASQALSQEDQCHVKKNECDNKSKALQLKIIAIVSILITSLIGVCLPFFSRMIPALHPDRSLFVIVKSFAGGIILATGFMHVLPDSFEYLQSPCLPEHPWHKFPFSGFVAMVLAIVTLMVDSIATSFYSGKISSGVNPESNDRAEGELKMGLIATGGHSHGHHMISVENDSPDSKLLRHRIVAMVLELGIVVHSVVIGLSLGASNNICTIKSLVAALCFHQMFEGMGLGGCILQAEYNMLKRAIMVFFFSTTTPFGVALGIGISNVYEENRQKSLMVEGLLNAASAGLLIYMALVDLLASDFMGPKLQGSIKLQLKSYIAVFVGAGGMSLMAKWA